MRTLISEYWLIPESSSSLDQKNSMFLHTSYRARRRWQGPGDCCVVHADQKSSRTTPLVLGWIN